MPMRRHWRSGFFRNEDMAEERLTVAVTLPRYSQAPRATSPQPSLTDVGNRRQVKSLNLGKIPISHQIGVAIGRQAPFV
jgi:hypothetical protein